MALPPLVPVCVARLLGAGVENCDVVEEAFAEEVGGFSTKDVSVVLMAVSKISSMPRTPDSLQKCLIRICTTLGI